MSLASCLTALPRNIWCQTLVTLQAGRRYELQLHASATGIMYNKNTENIIPLYLKRFLHWTVVYLGTVQVFRRFSWSAGVDSNHHMAAYKTASLNHWRTRGYGRKCQSRTAIPCP